MQHETFGGSTLEKRFHTPQSMLRCAQEVFDGEYFISVPPDEIETILDVGANIGAFTAWALSVFPKAHIHAYEPNPKAIEYWKKNITDPRATLHEIAVTVQRDAHLFAGVHNLGQASVHQALAGGEDLGAIRTELPCRLPKADFIKLDCEGCEAEFIADSREAYQHKPKIWALEYHSQRDADSIKGALHWEYDLVKAIEYDPAKRGLQIWRKKALVKGKASDLRPAAGSKAELYMKLTWQIERFKAGFSLDEPELGRLVAQLEGVVVP